MRAAGSDNNGDRRQNRLNKFSESLIVTAYASHHMQAYIFPFHAAFQPRLRLCVCDDGDGDSENQTGQPVSRNSTSMLQFASYIFLRIIN